MTSVKFTVQTHNPRYDHILLLRVLQLYANFLHFSAISNLKMSNIITVQECFACSKKEIQYILCIVTLNLSDEVN